MLDVLQPKAILLADRSYDNDAIRALAAGRGAWANIPPRKTLRQMVYRQRNLVER
ncbi:transposase (fragment) [Mesorhizobium prunaredense]|uniref:Transposase n=1 Tax=Mesorhizobium prunaredense TaxID=1631249 RepID=A0A1R3V462_9HYPH